MSMNVECFFKESEKAVYGRCNAFVVHPCLHVTKYNSDTICKDESPKGQSNCGNIVLQKINCQQMNNSALLSYKLHGVVSLTVPASA